MAGGNGKSKNVLGRHSKNVAEGKILIGRLYFNILKLKEDYYV